MPFAKGQSGNPAGRPRRAEKYARPVARAEKQIVDHLPELVDNLLALADGGYTRVRQRWEPAGLVFVDTQVAAENGLQTVKVLAYPDKPKDELVLVEQHVETADRDRAANQYLVDRILGKPTARQELTGPDGGAIEVHGLTDEQRAARIAGILDKIRARAPGPADAAGADLDAAAGPADGRVADRS